MKKSLFLSIAFIGLSICPNCFVNAQGVGVNSSGNNPDPSAIFDASASDKGMLLPRLTTAQRNAIVSPAKGLIIYNTDCDNLNYNAGTPSAPNWVFVNPSVTLPTSPAEGIHTPSTTQIVWNWNTVSGATGYKWGTTNVYGSATDNGPGTSYTQTGLTCNTSYTLYVWAYNDCGNSTAIALTQTTSVCPFPCGSALTITHTIGSIAPETKTINYGTVLTTIGGTGSKCWITQNLGSSNQAGSASDVTDAAAGWYWQFNRKQGYKVGPTPSWTITSINEASDWLPANDPCTIELGTGWRIPTYSEWNNADASGGWNNYNATYSSVLKLHAAGFISSGGTLSARGAYGFYWSSMQYIDTFGYFLRFTDSSSNMDWLNKANGVTLRCIKD